MRLKTGIWVAPIARCQIEGAAAVLRRRGARSRRHLHKVSRLDGTADLYGPRRNRHSTSASERARLQSRAKNLPLPEAASKAI